MTHSTRMFPYLLGGAAVAAVLIAVGAPLAALLPLAFVLACPLIMFVMMRGMAGTHTSEDHTRHGSEHDPTRTAESPASRRQ
jgi:DMSO reductase anchor subunit